MRLTQRLIGLLFILIPFVPTALLFEKKKIKGAETSFGPYQWFLGILIVVFVSYFLSLSPVEKFFKKLSSKISLKNVSNNYRNYCFVVLFIFLNLSAYYCFRHRPHLVDSIVQLFQAQTFAAGMLKAIPLKYPEFFVTQHMIFDETGWYSQYPPGHQLLLCLGVLIGAPWLVNIALTILSTFLAYKIAIKVYGSEHANLSLLLASFCPFLIFMGSDFMNHVPTLTCLIIFTYFYIIWEREQKARFLFFSGLAIGFAFLIRPLTALGMGLPFGIAALNYTYTNRKEAFKFISHLALSAIGALLFILFNFYYNFKMYGDPLIPGYIKLWGKGHDLGFHVSPWGEAHTPLTGIRNELTDIFLLNEYLFEWPIPVLILIGFYLFFTHKIERAEKIFIFSFLMLPCTYFFYWHRDAYLGPRFMYEGVIFLIFLTSSALLKIADYLKDKKFGLEGVLKPVSAKSVFNWSILICILYAITIGIPSRFTVYASSLKSIKFDITKRAKEEKIEKALIFTKVTWGVRLMAQLRGYGLSASLTQDAYSHCDHCRLQELLDQAKSNNWSSDELSSKVKELLAKRQEVKSFLKHVDTSLKLTGIETLSLRCKKELEYDISSNFSVYTSNLTANSPTFDKEYIVAMDLREKNKLLLEQYPNYPAYLYLPDKFIKLR